MPWANYDESQGGRTWVDEGEGLAICTVCSMTRPDVDISPDGVCWECEAEEAREAKWEQVLCPAAPPEAEGELR
jgi:hypothetical protein